LLATQHAAQNAQHTRLVKCADDANTYLVNDISDPLQRSLTSLHLTDVLLGAPPPGASSTYAPASSALHPVPAPCLFLIKLCSYWFLSQMGTAYVFCTERRFLR